MADKGGRNPGLRDGVVPGRRTPGNGAARAVAVKGDRLGIGRPRAMVATDDHAPGGTLTTNRALAEVDGTGTKGQRTGRRAVRRRIVERRWIGWTSKNRRM